MTNAKLDDVRIAYIIPTKDRPDDLRVVLASLERQNVKPDQIVIVDGSMPPVKDVCDAFPALKIDYVREFPPSLARQRNAGIAAVRDDIEFAGYLDDDLELEQEATEALKQFWQKMPLSVGGVAMNIVNQPQIRRNWFHRFFLMTGFRAGAVTPSGFQCPIPTVDEDTETRWLYGGATIWRRNVFEAEPYDEWFEGHGFGEDFEYSYRVGRENQLFVCANSKTWHHCGEMNPEKMYELGRQQVYNRFYMHRKMRDFSAVLFGWSIMGLICENFAGMILRFNKSKLDRIRGNLRGLWDGLQGKKEAYKAYWKD